MDLNRNIKIAIVGIGNCASSLIQGVYYYHGTEQNSDTTGLMHYKIGCYRPQDIKVVAAFDIDARKVGLDVNEAIFSAPNNTAVFQGNIKPCGTKVTMGKVLDGVADHMTQYKDKGFIVSDQPEATQQSIVRQLQASGADLLINYLPVGSEQATRFYAECALEAGIAFINCMPVFIASDPQWERRFREKNLPIVGDDIKAQLGATITHRTLSNLFKQRGVKLNRTYQINTGGNTDFLNMLNRNRLVSKKISKTEAVQAVIAERLDEEDIHIGPSDYVPWQKDNKVAFIRMEGSLFGNVPMNLELRLSVEDSPNSAGVAIDMIRCTKLALERGIGGVLVPPSAYFCKHPPQQFTDEVAYQMLEKFIHEGKVEASVVTAVTSNES